MIQELSSEEVAAKSKQSGKGGNTLLQELPFDWETAEIVEI